MVQRKAFVMLVTFVLMVSMVLAACSSGTSSGAGSETPNTPNTSNEQDNQTASEEVYKMKIGTATTNEVQTHIMDVFKETLESKVNGRIEVELYPSGQLGSNEQMNQQVASGSLEGVVSASSFGFDELLTVLDLPYLWPDIDLSVEYLNGEGGDKLRESMLEKKGVNLIRFYPYGPRTLLTKNKIETLEDLEGQKIRVQGAKVLVDKINAWGGAGIAMGVPELYTALQQGTIDGIENVAGVHYSGKYHDNAKYLLTESSSPLIIIFIVNNKWLESLPEDLQQAVMESAAEIDEEIKQYAKEFHESAIASMAEEGVEIVEPSAELHEQFVQASRNIVPEFIERIPEAGPIVDDVISKFSN